MEKFTDPLKNNQPFEIPEKFWGQLQEFTEGYICFYVTNDGEIMVRAMFDSAVIEEGIRAYSSRFLNGLNQSSEIQQTESFLNENSDNDGRDEFTDGFDPDDE